MTEFWLAAAGWAGHTALTGGLLLLLGWGCVRLVRAPARRHKLAAWVIRAAVLVPVLCLLPTWLTVPVPDWVSVGRRPPGRVVEAPPAVAAAEPEPVAPGLPEGEGEAVAWRMPERDARRGLVDLPGGMFDGLPRPDVTVTDAPPGPWAPSRPAVADATPRPADAQERGLGPVIRHKPGENVRRPAPPPLPQPVESHLADVAPYVLLPYWVLAGAFLGQLLLGHLALRRWRARGEPAPARVQAIFDGLAAGFPAKPELRVSDRIASPAAFGLTRATVLLPRPLAVAGTTAELRWVFAHELDHLRRGDHQIGWWVGAARAVYFFVPWFWPLRRELRLAQEYLADAAAAAAGGSPVDYAAFLVNLSGGPSKRRPARPPLPATGVRAGRSDLFRRVTMLLDPHPTTGRRVSRGWAALAAGGALSAAVLLSGLGLAVADDEKPQVKPRVKVVASGDEKAPDKKPGEKKPARDGDKEKAKPDTADGDTKAKAKAEADTAERKAKVAELKKKIAEAAKSGDIDEMQKAIDELTKLLTAQEGRPGFDFNVNPLPPVPPVPPVGPFGKVDEEQFRRFFEQSLKGLERAMDRMKDNPQVREQMQKAMDEYKRAMEEALKQGNFPKGFPGFPVFPGGDDNRFQLRFADKGPGGVRLGVAVGPVPEALAEQLDLPKGQGALVNQVLPGTPAEKAGLKKNDVILTFAGKDVTGPEGFAEMVARAKGEKVDLTVLRKGKKQKLEGVALSEPREPKEPKKPAEPRKRVETNPGDADKKAGGKRVNFDSVRIQIQDGEFTIRAVREDVRYDVSGSLKDGKAVPSSIAIRAGGEKAVQAESLDKVPEQHRAAVEQLLGNLGGGAK